VKSCDLQTPTAAGVDTIIAFDKRHPENTRTRNVYDRAHKRLHGRYPD
jgi:hypothetical protein